MPPSENAFPLFFPALSPLLRLSCTAFAHKAATTFPTSRFCPKSVDATQAYPPTLDNPV